MVCGQQAERFAGRNAVDAGAQVKRGERRQQDKQDYPEARAFHCVFLLEGILKHIKVCTRYRQERETRNISQPENSWKKPTALSGFQY